jgi:hypothetical protein
MMAVVRADVSVPVSCARPSQRHDAMALLREEIARAMIAGPDWSLISFAA